MAVPRPVFRERQVLGAADFADEQAARIGRLAQHGRAAHAAGVASGFTLELDGDSVIAAPGSAVLPSGRFVCSDTALRIAAPATTGVYRISLSAVETLPALSMAASRQAGDHVVLGTLDRGAASLQLSSTGRAWLGARGDRVEAPDGSATLALGRNELRAQPELAVAFGDEPPILRVDALRGGRVSGSLSTRPAPGAVASRTKGARLVFAATGTPPETPAPWTLRRVMSEIEGTPVDEIRLELHHPGKSGDPARSRLHIGTDDTGLILDAEGTLTLLSGGEIAGDGISVVPPGRIAFAPVKPGPTDPAFAQALTDAMLQGLTWALIFATINTGVTGLVTRDSELLEGVAVMREGGAGHTVTDADGRFFLATVGWPGETVLLQFEEGGQSLGTLPAVVASALQSFEFQSNDGGGEII